MYPPAKHLAALVLLLLPYLSPGQPTIERPAPGSIKPPVQDDGESLLPEDPEISTEDSKGIGFVRVWNLSDAHRSAGIALFLTEQGRPVPPPEQRLWLARGARAPELRDYAAVPQGNYDLYAVADDSTQGDMKPIPEFYDPERQGLLPRPLGLAVAPASFQTILLRSGTKGLSAEVLADSSLPAERRTLRVFNMIPSKKAALFRISGHQRVPIAEDLSQPSAAFAADPKSANQSFELSFATSPSTVGRLSVEANFAGVRSCSLLICNDRYERPTLLAARDAPLPAPATAPSPPR